MYQNEKGTCRACRAFAFFSLDQRYCFAAFSSLRKLPSEMRAVMIPFALESLVKNRLMIIVAPLSLVTLNKNNNGDCYEDAI